MAVHDGKTFETRQEVTESDDSVLIVTIDEKEYLTSWVFVGRDVSEAQIQMVSITTNPSGARKSLFSRALMNTFL